MASQLACSADAFCASDAVFPGVGLTRLATQLERLQLEAPRLSEQHRRINVQIVGNSVARWQNYCAARTFQRLLKLRWPALNFAFDQYVGKQTNSFAATSHADPLSLGGFGREHALFCGLDRLATADIVLVLYSEGLATSSKTQAEFYRQLLSLPRSPLVVVIRHCTLLRFEMLVASGPFREASRTNNISLLYGTTSARRDKHTMGKKPARTNNKWGVEFLQVLMSMAIDGDRLWREESVVLRSLNLTHVDMCALLQTVHTRRCSTPRTLFVGAPPLPSPSPQPSPLPSAPATPPSTPPPPPPPPPTSHLSPSPRCTSRPLGALLGSAAAAASVTNSITGSTYLNGTSSRPHQPTPKVMTPWARSGASAGCRFGSCSSPLGPSESDPLLFLLPLPSSARVPTLRFARAFKCTHGPVCIHCVCGAAFTRATTIT